MIDRIWENHKYDIEVPGREGWRSFTKEEIGFRRSIKSSFLHVLGLKYLRLVGSEISR